MADIAILIVEQYERMIKSNNLASASTTTTVAVGRGSVALAADRLRETVWVEEIGGKFKPRSQLGLAAFSGLFSA